MTEIDIARELQDLFSKAGNAHHKAFIKTNGEDPDWPLWYADHLHDKLGKLLKATFTKSELVYMLVTVEKERGMMAPGSNWPTYYANFFIERYL